MTEPIVLHQKINLPYRYTAGKFHRAFLRGLEQGRIVGSTCSNCDTVSAPARPFCPDCAAHSAATVDLEASGSLVTWTTLQRDGEEVTFGMIQIDGADTLMLHLIDVPRDDLVAGLPVVPRWSAEPSADITAIEAFVPAS